MRQFLRVERVRIIAVSLMGFFISFQAEANTVTRQAAAEDVLQNYEKQLLKNPENASLLYALAKAYYSEGNYPRSIELFRRALKLDPGNQDALASLALAYLFTNQLEMSQKTLEKMAPDQKLTPDVLAAIGRIDQLHYRFQEAEGKYRQALEKDPDNLMALSFLGSLKLEQKQYSDALKIFKIVQEREPGSQWIKQDILKARLGPEIESVQQIVDEGEYEKAAAQYESLLSENRDFLDLYLLLGDLFVKMKKFNKARSLYQLAMELHPESVPLINAIGFAYLQEGNARVAKEQFRKSLQIDPRNSNAMAGMGEVALKMGMPAKAEMMFKESLRDKPFNLTSLIYLAKLQTEQKQYQEVVETYQKILKVLPNKPWVIDAINRAEYGGILDLIKQKDKQKEYKAVEELYQTIIRRSPENVEFRYQLGNLYFNLKEYPKAIDIYREALSIDGQSIPVLTGLGFAYLGNGEINKGEEIFIRIHDLENRNSDALVGLGAVAEYDGNFKKAEQLYLEALNSDPFNENALLHLGKIKLKEGKNKTAERLFKKIKELNPDDEWIDSLILNAKNNDTIKRIKEFEEQGRDGAAEQLYRDLLLNFPNFPDYYLSLGSLYMKTKRFQAAEEIYIKGLTRNPHSASLLTALGFAYIEENRVEEAREIFQSVLQTEPGNSEALTGIGSVELKEKNFAQAEEFFNKALASEPENMRALTQLADLYLETNRNEMALAVYHKLHALFPNEEWIKFAAQDIRYASLLKEISRLEEVGKLSGEEKDKQLARAEVLLRQLLKEAPGNPYYAIRLGLLLREMKRFSEALSVYRQGLIYHPDNIPLKVAVAFAYLFLEDYHKARRQFHSVLDSDPENADALAGLGRVEDLTGNPNAAESYYRQALLLDPYNVNALSFLAALSIEKNQYQEAQTIYEQLSTLHPGSEWIEKGIEEAKAAPLLDQANSLERSGLLEEAAGIYTQILSQIEDNADYYLRLGHIYVQMRQYSKAVEIFNRGLKKNPNDPNLITAIGIAYLLDRDVGQAKPWLDRAYALIPKNAEVLAGLGRVEFLCGNLAAAEAMYQNALEQSQDNITALSFYGEHLMRQRRYEEALGIYNRLYELEPDSAWVREARTRAMNGPQVDAANLLVQLGEWRRAKREYLKLLSISGNSEYYLYLGDLYFAKDKFDKALRIYRLGLIANPNSEVLWKAIANVNLSRWCLGESARIFNCLIALNSDDADSWAGLGRVWALRGCYHTSLVHFRHALNIEPNNETALIFMAEGEVDQEHFFSAKSLYKKLCKMQPGQTWIRERVAFLNMITHPSVNFLGRYYEEDEWDRRLDEWVARYQVYGAGVRVSCPISDRFRFSTYVREDYYKLVNQEDDFTYYFFDLTRAYVESRWQVSPCLYVDANLGVVGYSPYKREAFSQRHGTVVEPTLLFTWNLPRTRSVFGFSSDTDLVARDFDDNRAMMVTRYYVTERIEHDFLDTLTMGLEGGYYHLNGFRENQFQRAVAFAAWTPESWRDWFSVRYFFQYQNFNHVIPDYYTYAPQLVNHLQFELSKRWDEIGYIKVGYAHGWQNTRTRFQQIIINQPPILQPFFWDRRDYNTCFIQAAYNQCPIKLAVDGSFYRDSKKYTIWYADIAFGWIF